MVVFSLINEKIVKNISSIDPPMATGGKIEVHMPWNIDLWKFEPKGYTVTKL